MNRYNSPQRRHDVYVTEIDDPDQARREMKRIGVHPYGIDIMAPKAVFRVVKVTGVSSCQANVIKQEMLSIGADSANAAGCIDCSREESDILLMGTIAQLGRLCSKLERQPPSFQHLSRNIKKALQDYDSEPKLKWELPGCDLECGSRTLIMGVVNVTPDSFSDGGAYFNHEAAAEHALRLEKEGADIVDIGGESTRPGSDPVSPEQEQERVLPVLENLKEKIRIPVSIDTKNASTAEQAVKRGAVIVNDVTALSGDDSMARFCSEAGVGVVLMHMLGTPKTMQKNPEYEDVVAEVGDYLEERISAAREAGIPPERIVTDPGIGFGKTMEHNLALLRSTREFISRFHRPLLIGVSRKRLIGELTGKDVSERVFGTVGAVVTASAGGGTIMRMHDVAACRDALKVSDAIRSKGSTRIIKNRND